MTTFKECQRNYDNLTPADNNDETCPYCGAVTSDGYCDYCDSQVILEPDYEEMLDSLE